MNLTQTELLRLSGSLAALAVDVQKLIDVVRPLAAPQADPADDFVTVPDVTLPCGTVVPSFRVGRYLCSKGANGRARVTAEGVPWVRINYRDARKACEAAGYALITEMQALALAHEVARMPENWTDGNVGRGALRQGLHRGSVTSAQPGTYEPDGDDEMREFMLSNGETVFDVAGNAYTWVFDDVQGDDEGLVGGPFAAGSPSLMAPFPRQTMGVGWRPEAGEYGSGTALIRGGYWGSYAAAGVFGLGRGRPDCERDGVGFRCTAPAVSGPRFPVAA